jgi:hypothetical protein
LAAGPLNLFISAISAVTAVFKSSPVFGVAVEKVAVTCFTVFAAVSVAVPLLPAAVTTNARSFDESAKGSASFPAVFSDAAALAVAATLALSVAVPIAV